MADASRGQITEADVKICVPLSHSSIMLPLLTPTVLTVRMCVLLYVHQITECSHPFQFSTIRLLSGRYVILIAAGTKYLGTSPPCLSDDGKLSNPCCIFYVLVHTRPGSALSPPSLPCAAPPLSLSLSLSVSPQMNCCSSSVHLSLLLFFYALADICDGDGGREGGRAGFYPKVDHQDNFCCVWRCRTRLRSSSSICLWLIYFLSF